MLCLQALHLYAVRLFILLDPQGRNMVARGYLKRLPLKRLLFLWGALGDMENGSLPELVSPLPEQKAESRLTWKKSEAKRLDLETEE